MTDPTDKPRENARPMTPEDFGAWINAPGGPLVIDVTRLVKTLANVTPIVPRSRPEPTRQPSNGVAVKW